ncbi:MAG: IS110 family transposase [Polyangiaceae bacterium]
MEVIVGRCCGLDVHQATIVACALVEVEGRRPRKEVRTFRAMHSELEALRGWLLSQQITHVTMEGTGVYWIPVYTVLEGHVDLTVVNARHVKKVPGRKTDVSDAEWLASLLRHGLLRKSFVPAKEIRVIRDVCRYRRMLVQSETTEKNRIIKLLETTGIKLASVATDVFGKSGMAMVRAIADGNVSVETMVQLAKSHLRRKLPDLRLALDVLVADHHRIMLRDQLARLDRTSEEIARYDARLDELVKPYAASMELLRTIPGMQRIAAIEVFAEVGPDLASFPDAAHFASWAGTCPGSNESAGKRGSTRRRRGNPYLQSILVEAALAATRKKDSFFKDKYHRLKARRGAMRAIFAIANKLAGAVYRALAQGQIFRDLGASFLDGRDVTKTATKLIERLRNLPIDPRELSALLSQTLASSTPAPSAAISAT